MRRTNKIFKAPGVMDSANKENREGYKAWGQSIEADYLQTLLTNTCGNTFYVKQKELIDEARAVHEAMLAKDPVFASKALVFARNRGYMRTQPIFGLALLSALHTLQCNQVFHEVFPKVILTPNDLADFTTIVSAEGHGQGGRAIKTAAGKWLLGLTEYWAIKYGAEKGGSYSLKDLLQVYHPKSGKPLPLFDYIMGRPAEGLPQIEAFNRLKKATTVAEKVAAITEGRLPHEVASTFAGKDAEVWKAIVGQMPVFAMLRHLATMERHGVMGSVRNIVVEKLTNAEVIGKSKILPFRFVEAMDHVEDSAVKDALRDAVDLSFANIPELPGRTAILLDVSGSMGSNNYYQTAALFGVCLMRKAGPESHMYLFDSDTYEQGVSRRDSLLTQASNITYQSYHGNRREAKMVKQWGGQVSGTWTSGPVRYMQEQNVKVDNMIVITDGEQNQGAPFAEVWAEYKRDFSRNLKTFIVDISPYRDAVTPQNEKDTWYIYGWSDAVLGYISLAIQGYGSMVEQIGK